MLERAVVRTVFVWFQISSVSPSPFKQKASRIRWQSKKATITHCSSERHGTKLIIHVIWFIISVIHDEFLLINYSWCNSYFMEDISNTQLQLLISYRPCTKKFCIFSYLLPWLLSSSLCCCLLWKIKILLLLIIKIIMMMIICFQLLKTVIAIAMKVICFECFFNYSVLIDSSLYACGLSIVELFFCCCQRIIVNLMKIHFKT